jgi:putative methionine-R-sulfoxide reductase with GAF domain
MNAVARDYDGVVRAVAATGDREARMRAVVDALWDELHGKGVSWVGFYLKREHADEMILAERRDTPACSPIGLHGACGRVYLTRRPLVVTDVSHLGAGYIACDPRDRSEVVVPLMDGVGDGCWGVLDVDSHQTGAFGAADVHGLLKVVEHAGLSVPRAGVEIETV